VTITFENVRDCRIQRHLVIIFILISCSEQLFHRFSVVCSVPELHWWWIVLSKWSTRILSSNGVTRPYTAYALRRTFRVLCSLNTNGFMENIFAMYWCLLLYC